MKKIQYKLIIIVIILISIIVFLVYKNFYRLDKRVNIFEIPNTRELYANNNFGEEILYVDEYYMITNPPEELEDLKILIEKFEKDNKIQEKFNSEAKKYSNNANKGFNNRIFSVTFYREGPNFHRSWQPKKGYISSDDTIDKHKDDIIAHITWSLPQGKKQTLVFKKDKDRDNYGKLIEYKEY